MSLDSIKAALYTWFKREAGVAIIWGNQGKPRPALPYGEIVMNAPTKQEQPIDELKYDRDADNFFTEGNRMVTVTLNLFGEASIARMTDVLNSLDDPQVISHDFEIEGIAHVGQDGPNDLTELEDTDYVERAQMDLQIRFASTPRVSTIEAIEEVTVTTNSGGGVTITEDRE